VHRRRDVLVKRNLDCKAGAPDEIAHRAFCNFRLLDYPVLIQQSAGADLIAGDFANPWRTERG
jgi:hypothetical protein